jgi:cell wall-associated NlpC family hydrolase
MSHWASDYIGGSWKFGATGPDAYDCWGFVRTVQRERYGIHMPAVEVPATWRAANELINSHDERIHWQKVDQPKDGDLVLMARSRRPVHIGVVIRADGRLGVLHCIQPSGVVFSSMLSLPSVGWGSLTFYRRA